MPGRGESFSTLRPTPARARVLGGRLGCLDRRRAVGDAAPVTAAVRTAEGARSCSQRPKGRHRTRTRLPLATQWHPPLVEITSILSTYPTSALSHNHALASQGSVARPSASMPRGASHPLPAPRRHHEVVANRVMREPGRDRLGGRPQSLERRVNERDEVVGQSVPIHESTQANACCDSSTRRCAKSTSSAAVSVRRQSAPDALSPRSLAQRRVAAIRGCSRSTSVKRV